MQLSYSRYHHPPGSYSSGSLRAISKLSSFKLDPCVTGATLRRLIVDWMAVSKLCGGSLMEDYVFLRAGGAHMTRGCEMRDGILLRPLSYTPLIP